MFYNDFIGKETLSKEYKEFSFFKTGLRFENEKMEEYCRTNKFEFNNLVLENMKKYIRQYIPRYATSFWNSRILESEFYIGVNDYGIIKGIPFQGDFPLDFIQEKLKKTLEKYVGYDDPMIRADFRDISIQFEMIKVESMPTPETEVHQEYADYCVRKTQFSKKVDIFAQKYKDWKETYDVINYKLVDIANMKWSREMLIAYVKSHPNTEKITDLLESDFKLEPISGEELKLVKIDKTNLYYWVTEYKDLITNEYRKNKPVFNQTFSKTTPFNLLVSGEMSPFWVRDNPNMNMYVLKITMKMTKLPIFFFSYYDVIYEKWMKCKRVNDIHPMCLNFN